MEQNLSFGLVGSIENCPTYHYLLLRAVFLCFYGQIIFVQICSLCSKMLYWINLENYSFKIDKNIFIPYFTNHCLYKKLFGFLLYWCLQRFHEKKCAVFENWCQRKRKCKSNIDAQTFSWNRGVTKWFIHFDKFWRVFIWI